MVGQADAAQEAAVKTALDACTAAGATVLSIAQQAGVLCASVDNPTDEDVMQRPSERADDFYKP